MEHGIKTHLFKGTWIMEQLKHREFGSVLFVCLYVWSWDK